MELHIALAFFKDDELLARGEVWCGVTEMRFSLDGVSGHRFDLTCQFEEPACPVEIRCYCHEEQLYKAALRVGVHTSGDWESINLADIHTLGFRCREVKIAEQGGCQPPPAAVAAERSPVVSPASLVNEASLHLPGTAAPDFRRRVAAVSWFCAVSPFALLGLFLTVALHIRLGLGHWPAPMFEVYHSPAFDFHAGALFVFAASCLYAAGPLWLVCLLIPRLRPAWPRAVVLQLITAAIGWLLMLGVLTWDPTTFSAWI